MNSLKDTYRSVIRQIFNSCKAEDSGFQDESELYTQENDMHLILASGSFQYALLQSLLLMTMGVVKVVYERLPIVPEDEAKQILERYVSRKSFYGKKAAKKCQVLSYDHGCAFRYILHSLTESRSVSGSTEPYKDQNIDGPDNGDMPDIWTVGKPPPPSVIVKNETHTYRIPHTSKIITCGECQGKGTGPCRSCDGMGVRTCQYCNGNRYHEVTEAVHVGAGNYGTPTRQEFRHVQKPCHHCHGSGDMTCYTCNGHRTENCHKCMGRKRLVRYKVVTVKWETNTSGHVSDTAGIPQSKLLTCRGKQIFYKEKEKLNGLYSNDILHVETQAIAKKYLAQHQKRYKTIIRQCHSVDIIQTTTVQYAYRDRFYKFVIYGPDKAVYASDYPQRTFFGCSMM